MVTEEYAPFIDQLSLMIDRPSRNRPVYARTSDLRMDGVRFDLVRLEPPFGTSVNLPHVALFYFVMQGSAWLEAPGQIDGPLEVTTGMAVSMEHGRHHVWRHSRPEGRDLPARDPDIASFADDLAPDTTYLLMGRIAQKNVPLNSVSDDFIAIPPHTEPYSTILKRVAALIAAELAMPQADRAAVERRAAEIIVIQLVRFGLEALRPEMGQLPLRAAHDERILRALTAFYEDPARSWRVQDLADAAGLSRSAFAARFHALIGEPPLSCINRLRMQRAAAALHTGPRTIADIAQSVGFRSDAAFIRAFRRHFGTTPGNWREVDRETPEEAAPARQNQSGQDTDSP